MSWHRKQTSLLTGLLIVLCFEEDGVATSDDVEFVSGTVEFCYSKLIANSNCCLDSQLAAGVKVTTLNRPKTRWRCRRKDGCDDAWWGGGGERGTDLLWTPEGADCSSPRILYLHGGSWMYNSPESSSYKSLASKLARLTGALVMVIDYPLVPIGTYSAILQFALEALVWLAGHCPGGRAFAGNPPPLLVGGDSSGGGSAASLVLKTQVEAGRWPTIAGAFLYSPWMNLQCDTPTYYHNSFAVTEFAGKKVYTGDIIFRRPPAELSRQYKRTALRYVGGNSSLLADPVASPFFVETLEAHGTAPFYIAVSGTESITGDSWGFASKLSQQGVRVDLDVYPGMWHVFPMYAEGCGSGRRLWQASLALNRTAEFVRAAAMASSGRGSLHTCSPAAALQVALHYSDPAGPISGLPVAPLHPMCSQEAALSRTKDVGSNDGAPVADTFGLGLLLGAVCGAFSMVGIVLCRKCLASRSSDIEKASLKGFAVRSAVEPDPGLFGTPRADSPAAGGTTLTRA
eukprot:TRINITY_DN31352_c0_g1_i2.p1 TRINITY_DN31352_c0_g1~~TRINITY_DN31352_c0_g1_i2.p1  ORF type:complete len:514 (-),score=91.15 TRINITY_DN31352_c0_g1_i2:22-1563(-)